MKLRANLMLTLAAFIWGFAFVAQRVGMDYLGPFTFNGLRFALGAVSLLPLIWYLRRNREETADISEEPQVSSWRIGVVAGMILFIGASLQQIGLIYTTAGKAAFITCLYIVLVPLTGLFLKQKITNNTWVGAFLAVMGLYFLCVKSNFTISYGDFLELIGAGFWTAHILLIDRYANKVDTLQLAFYQFVACATLSLVVVMFTEHIAWNAVMQAAVPLLYGGLCSVGIAYTLQIVGQKHAEPTHAALILSMETVFAALGGFLILHEFLGARELLGMGLMALGIVATQLPSWHPNGEKTC